MHNDLARHVWNPLSDFFSALPEAFTKLPGNEVSGAPRKHVKLVECRDVRRELRVLSCLSVQTSAHRLYNTARAA